MMVAPADDADDLKLNENDSDEDEDGYSTCSNSGTCSDGAADVEPHHGDAVNNNKKKKKKKKKKNKGESGGQDNGTACASASASSGGAAAGEPSKAEADKRFKAAMISVQGGEEMWVQLRNSKVFDAKTKKLMDALKSNESVTSVDLSQNHISDDGAAAISSMLGLQGAPQLISLDLRDNPFTENGLTILDGLRKIRKQLAVKTGMLEVEKDLEISESSDTGKENGPSLEAKGPMFKKYFQSSDEDEDSELEIEVEKQHITDANEIWEQVHTYVGEGLDSIPQLLERLQHLSTLIQAEASPCEDSDALGGPALTGRPHASTTLTRGLPTLEKILAMVPRKLTLQHATQPHNAVGNHRVWASDIVTLLLDFGDAKIDKAVHKSKLVPQVLHLVMGHPLCSGLQARAIRMLQSCINSDLSAEFLLPILTQAGWGVRMEQSDGSAVAPLTQQFSDLGSASVDLPSGARSPIMGCVLSMSKALLDMCDSDEKGSKKVRDALKSNSSWARYTTEDGDLKRMLAEQEGDLGGPRAVPQLEDNNSELAERACGGLMSGQDILALLQGMSGMSLLK